MTRAAAPSFRASTPDGGGAGGVPRMFSRIHLPRLTGEVRVGFDVAARTLAWVSTPPRGVPASETRRKPSPRDAGDAVVPGQSFVDERVVRVEELEHAAVLVLDRLGRRARVSSIIADRSDSSNSGKSVGSGAKSSSLRV